MMYIWGKGICYHYYHFMAIIYDNLRQLAPPLTNQSRNVELTTRQPCYLAVAWHRRTLCYIKVSITPCLKKTSHLWLASLDIHDPITIIFGRSVTGKVRNQMTPLFSHLTYSVSALPCEIGNPENTGALCMQHSPTLAGLSTSFLLNHISQQPCGLNALITWFRESYSIVNASSESTRLKKSNSQLNSGNALIPHLCENAIFVFLHFTR